MTENEMEIIRILREADDPAKALETAMDILTRYLAGESIGSISASSGLEQTTTGFVTA